ncbi:MULTISPECIES: ion channel [unclassified Sphingosinithalassobacter]|uniref:ion channel n=1 Tax=unclassified Sphingosinithalassobacter TaxID=2676235 RepID=UPI00165E855D|nr:ion channel [Sphingosinithalassobacter sp. CS137]
MQDDFIALALGVGLVGLLGIIHHYGILATRRITPDPNKKAHLSMLTLFPALLLLHLFEIALFAGVYYEIARWPMFGELADTYPRTWSDYLYFSGINFATLGYTELKTDGPIRLVSMMQSLGGFMIITWSATFIYSVWGDQWRKD